jgi:hypothetical protein
MKELIPVDTAIRIVASFPVEAVMLGQIADQMRESGQREITNLLGMPVRIDPSLAPDEIRIEHADADIIRIVGIGKPAAPDPKNQES